MIDIIIFFIGLPVLIFLVSLVLVWVFGSKPLKDDPFWDGGKNDY